MKKIIIILCVIFIILIGIYIGIRMYNKSNFNDNLILYNENSVIKSNAKNITSIEISSNEEEKTTPNTLIIYKTYYTKCKHYIQKYEDIDVSLVNYNYNEFKEANKGWSIEKFSAEEIILSKQEEKFCNQHYKLKIKDNNIIIYNVDEEGKEIEYEKTNITTEYLTEEDILKLKNGIIIYGKENLISAIEDYE